MRWNTKILITLLKSQVDSKKTRTILSVYIKKILMQLILRLKTCATEHTVFQRKCENIGYNSFEIVNLCGNRKKRSV